MAAAGTETMGAAPEAASGGVTGTEENKGNKGRKRVYCSVVADLLHVGHVRLLKAAKHCAENVELIVGVCGDHSAARKRTPIMTLQERAEVVAACRYVDKVIEGAPYVTDISYLQNLNIDHVVHGDDLSDEQFEEFYPGLLSREGMLIKVPYSTGISTASIIQRIQRRVRDAESSETPRKRSRQERWHDIWLRKGMQRTSSPLHHVNGFLQLSETQYAGMVSTLADPIGIKSGSSVLDCGCGAGAFLAEIQKQYKCKRLAGVDYSQSLINVAKLSIESTDLHVSTICDLSRWQDETFDVVLSFSVYFYLSSVEDVKQALGEAIRVCKKGGSIFVGDVSDLAKKELALRLRGKTHKTQEKLSSDSPDHLYLPQELFRQIAAEKGMTNVRIVPHDETPLLGYYDTAPYRFSVYMDKPE